MSKHDAIVITIDKMLDCSNSNNLSIIQIDGYQCLVNKSEWILGELAVFIPPDTMVDTTRPEFAFLKKEGRNQERIRARKLRGHISQGLLVKAPVGASLGDDCWAILALEHYEPPIDKTTGGDFEQGPPGYYPVYDVANFNKYPHVIGEGEEVFISEKIHGTSARYKWHDGRMYCSSRTGWKKEDPRSFWWIALAQNPWIGQWCQDHPTMTLYGEVFGQVQNLKYGARQNDIFFRVFDVWDGARWLSFNETTVMRIVGDIRCPILYTGPFNQEFARALAEEDSSISGAAHHREGVVIRPIEERWDEKIGRVQLKLVGNRYLMKD